MLNQDLHIATLNDKSTLEMEIMFGYGIGYVSADNHKFSEDTIGLIAIDSIFTPITNVNFNVENVRIGDRNDYEKLILRLLLMARLPQLKLYLKQLIFSCNM